MPSLHDDLLKQANQLVTHEPRRPRQASLRRGISSAYYALFHLLIDEATKSLVSGRDRGNLSRNLGRAFSHAEMKEVAQQFANSRVSPKIISSLNGQSLQPELIQVATIFVDLQQARHEADYNTARRFTKQEALDLVRQVEQAFSDWRTVRRTLQAETFLIALLVQKRMRT